MCSVTVQQILLCRERSGLHTIVCEQTIVCVQSMSNRYCYAERGQVSTQLFVTRLGKIYLTSEGHGLHWLSMVTLDQPSTMASLSLTVQMYCGQTVYN